MSLPKDSPRAPSRRSSAGAEKASERRAVGHFDARDVLAGCLDHGTVAQAVEDRR